jgi:hypothetical protein
VSDFRICVNALCVVCQTARPVLTQCRVTEWRTCVNTEFVRQTLTQNVVCPAEGLVLTQSVVCQTEGLVTVINTKGTGLCSVGMCVSRK